MTVVPPFDDLDVIAGQGTVGLEILRQAPRDLGSIFVPIGGGGLAAGLASVVKELRPDVRIIGVEPDDSDAMTRSLAAGERVVLEHVGRFADGVAVRQVGVLTFDLCRRHLDGTLTVIDRRDLRRHQGRLRGDAHRARAVGRRSRSPG